MEEVVKGERVGGAVGDNRNIYNFNDRDRFKRSIAVWEIVHEIEKKGKNDELNSNQQMKGCRLKRFNWGNEREGTDLLCFFRKWRKIWACESKFAEFASQE